MPRNAGYSRRRFWSLGTADHPVLTTSPVADRPRVQHKEEAGTAQSVYQAGLAELAGAQRAGSVAPWPRRTGLRQARLGTIDGWTPLNLIPTNKDMFEMRKQFFVALAATTVLMPSAALAQTPSEAGRDVGTAVGDAVGGALAIPGAVIEAVTGLRGPSVRVEERIVVGEPLPTVVEVRPVPSYTEYHYAIVNERRIIVEPRTRRVVRIIE
jgi:hypothetical protein